jgi:hypothetical protein
MTQINDIQTTYLANLKSAEMALIAARAELLEALRALGVCSVDIDYEGYDDDGSVSQTVITPCDIVLENDLEHRLENFAFDFAYDLNPGFEIDGGASGHLNWDLNADSIDVQHHQCYQEYVTTLHEGL